MKYQIDIFSEPVDWKWSPSDIRHFLPATQTWMIELSQAFARLGHGVTIYWDGKDLDDHGVHYRKRAQYDHKSQIVIGWNHPSAFPEHCEALKAIYWTNGPEIWPELQHGNSYSYEGIDHIVGFCRWHEAELKKNLPHVASKILSIGPGLDPKEFSAIPPDKRKRHFLYASSWDRGLNHLLRFWSRIKRELSDSQLFITYGQTFSEKVLKQKLPLPDGINQPGIHLLGQIDRSEMARLYEECSYLLYPCSGGERFCLTTWKAQYTRCYPIFYPTMALEETVKAGWRTTPNTFCESVFQLGRDSGKARFALDKLRNQMEFPTWDQIALAWERLFKEDPVEV